MSAEQQNVLLALIVVGFPIIFMVGNATMAGIVVYAFGAMLKSPVLIAFLEKLYNAQSPEAQAAFLAALRLGEEVSDGVPAETKGNAMASASADR